MLARSRSCSVSDLLEYINEAEQKDKDALKRKARKAKVQYTTIIWNSFPSQEFVKT